MFCRGFVCVQSGFVPLSFLLLRRRLPRGNRLSGRMSSGTVRGHFFECGSSHDGDRRSRALRDLRFLSALRPSEEAYRRAIAGVRAAERREDLQQAMFQIVPLLGARDLYFLFLTAAEMPEKPMRLFLRTLDGLCQREEKHAVGLSGQSGSCAGNFTVNCAGSRKNRKERRWTAFAAGSAC